MSSVDYMAQDMECQLVDLPAMPLPEAALRKTILVGSGDSYAAALAARYLSFDHVSCCHPADIVAEPALVRDADVYFISISGRTKTNVLAAKTSRLAGAVMTAITTDPTSPLAAACDSVFVLKFRSAGKTSGTISFTAPLLACTRIAVNAICPADIKAIYNDAAKRAASLADNIGTKSIVTLGNSVLYPVAMYGALKFSEVFGSRTATYPLEDFCHAPLFGHREDQVIAFGIKNDVVISHRLRHAGIKVAYIDCGKYCGLGAIFYATFFMQHITLAIARERKVKECYFLQNKKLLDASSDIIY